MTEKESANFFIQKNKVAIYHTTLAKRSYFIQLSSLNSELIFSGQLIKVFKI